MPTIREFATSLRRRSGVEAVIVSGKDGLLIEGASTETLDSQDLAARVPSLLSEAAGIGEASGDGDCITGILEHERGYTLITSVGNEAILTVLASKNADLGQLLFDIRSHRSNIGALV